VEQPKPEELVQLLEAKGKDPLAIIEVLLSIVKQQMMYGGTLEDKLNYYIHNIKN